MSEKTPDHHVRLEGKEPDMSGAVEWFKDISGVIIVRHEGGKQGEHPHLHIWYPLGKVIQPSAVLTRFKKLDWAKDKQFVGNQQWSSRYHNNVSSWIDYVTCQAPTQRKWWKKKAPKVIVNNSVYSFTNECPPEYLDVDKDPDTVEATIKSPTTKKSKSASQHDKYMSHMASLYAPKPEKDFLLGLAPPSPSLDVCIKEYVKCCKCKYFARYGIPSIKHAWWLYNENSREEIEERCFSEIKRLLTETF